MALPRADIFQSGTIDKINVHPAVIIEIENGDATTHAFHDELLLRTSAGEVEIDSRRSGCVGKGNLACGWITLYSWGNRMPRGDGMAVCRSFLRLREAQQCSGDKGQDYGP